MYLNAEKRIQVTLAREMVLKMIQINDAMDVRPGDETREPSAGREEHKGEGSATRPLIF